MRRFQRDVTSITNQHKCHLSDN